MGLDMFLFGRKTLYTNWEHPEQNRLEDGIEISSITVELGYWRKHPNLHGFIVKNYGGDKDECQRIDLNEEALRRIVAATMNKTLPVTTGFFFGSSRPEDDEETIKIMMTSIQWLTAKEEGHNYREIYYQASW